MPSTFTAFDKAKPTTAQTRQAAIDAIRTNLLAIVAAMVASGVTAPGWNYTNSVTLGEGTPGTADKPLRIYYKFGTGGTTIWIKAVVTWNGTTGNPDKIAFYYSDDNAGTYANLVDTSGNYVLTISYDASNNVTATTWGSTP